MSSPDPRPLRRQPQVVTGPMAIGVSHKGDSVWRCHILEHEDNDMMQRYVIERAP